MLWLAGGTELDKETDRLSLMSHEFRTVASQLLLLQLVADYLQILDILPSLAVEVAHRVVELVKARHLAGISLHV